MAVVLKEISSDYIDATSIKSLVKTPDAGALLEFHGIVRNHDAGREVVRLEYEGHETALLVLDQISIEVERKFPQVQFAISHRLGSLEIGDLAFYVVVASAHRDEAFEACRLLVEEVKEKIPVWKNQIYKDGSNEWVNSA